MNTGSYDTAEYIVQGRAATQEEYDFWTQVTADGGRAEFLTRPPFNWPKILEITEEDGPVAGPVYSTTYGPYENPVPTVAESYWYRRVTGRIGLGPEQPFQTSPWRILWMLLTKWEGQIRGVRFELDEKPQ